MKFDSFRAHHSYQHLAHSQARTEALCRSIEKARIGAHRLEAYGTLKAHRVTVHSQYNRHEVRREKTEYGEIKVVEKETYPPKNHRKLAIQRDIWEGALKSATKVEKKYGNTD